MAQSNPRSEYASLEKSMPSNIDAERMILGVILLDNSTLSQVTDAGMTDCDFSQPSHGRIYAAMLRLVGQDMGIDPITLQNELKRTDELDRVGGGAYIASLFDGVPRFSNIESYIRIVKDKAILRNLIRAAHLVESRAFDDDLPVN